MLVADVVQLSELLSDLSVFVFSPVGTNLLAESSDDKLFAEELALDLIDFHIYNTGL